MIYALKSPRKFIKILVVKVLRNLWLIRQLYRIGSKWKMHSIIRIYVQCTFFVTYIKCHPTCEATSTLAAQVSDVIKRDIDLHSLLIQTAYAQ